MIDPKKKLPVMAAIRCSRCSTADESTVEEREHPIEYIARLRSANWRIPDYSPHIFCPKCVETMT